MLKRRLVPKLLLQNRSVMGRPALVTTRRFEAVTVVGNPVSQAKIYEAQLADELIVLRIDDAPLSEDQPSLEVIERLAGETFMPLAIGGGVRDIDDFERLLERGADKVVVNCGALQNPDLVEQAARRFGAQCVVVSIDFRQDSCGALSVFARRGREPWRRDALEWASEVCGRGAGEIVACDIDRDGSGDGLNLDACRRLVDRCAVPVAITGGCGRAEHFVEGFRCGAEAVAAGTFFCLRDQNPLQARAHVRNAGIPIRAMSGDC